MKTFFKNWQTTVGGIAMISKAMVSILMSLSGENDISYDDIALLISGIGLLFAKVQSVTGGSKPNA